jgi:hypothetical protein
MALEIERENNNRVGILNSITNIGIAFAKAGQPKPAEKYLEEAETLVEEMEAYSFLPSILKLRSEILFKQGNSRDAYLTFIKYDSLREIIYGQESTRKIVQMELVLDFQEKEKELDMLKKEGEIQSLQLRNSRLFIVMMILGGLIIIGVINLYFMGNKKRLIRP